jgi:hypothetical protein
MFLLFPVEGAVEFAFVYVVEHLFVVVDDIFWKAVHGLPT